MCLHTNPFKMVGVHPAHVPSRSCTHFWLPMAIAPEKLLHGAKVLCCCHGAPPHWLPSQPSSAVPQICPPFSQAVCSYLPVPWVAWAFKTFLAQPCCPLLLSWGRFCPMFQRCQRAIHNLELFPRLQNEGSSSVLSQYSKKNPKPHLYMCPSSIVKANSVKQVSLNVLRILPQEFRMWGIKIPGSGTSSDPLMSLGRGHHN